MLPVVPDVHPPFSLSFLLKKYIWRFLGWAVIGAATAVAIACLLPKEWTATILFEVGQVGDSDRPLIDPAKVVQRIVFPGFVSEVVGSQPWSDSEETKSRIRLIEKTLSAKLTKSGNLVEMTVSGYSPRQAEDNLKAAFQLLEKEHLQLLQPSKDKLKDELEETTTSLKGLDDERTTLLDSINKVKGSPDFGRKFSEGVLLASMLKSNEMNRHLLISQQDTLKEQLSPYRTFATRVIAPLYVPKDPSFPRKDLFAVLGMLGGLLLVFGWTVSHDAVFRSVLAKSFFDGDEALMDEVSRA